MRLFEIINDVYRRNKEKTEALCEPMGVSRSQLYRYAEAPEGSGSPIPAEKLVVLVNETEDPSALRYLAAECGYLIVPIPDRANRPTRIKNITRELTKVMHECAELVQESSKALEDGIITQEERDGIDKEIDHVINEVLCFKEIIR